MQNFSYHTHTVFSDGVNTVDEMLAQAVNLGWSEIGISDHMIIHKNIKKVPYYEFLKAHNQTNIAYDDFDKALPVFNRHAEEVRSLAKKYPSLKVRVGYEVDYFTYDGWQKEFEKFRQNLDYDYMLTGNHFFLSDDGEYFHMNDAPSLLPRAIVCHLCQNNKHLDSQAHDAPGCRKDTRKVHMPQPQLQHSAKPRILMDSPYTDTEKLQDKLAPLKAHPGNGHTLLLPIVHESSPNGQPPAHQKVRRCPAPAFPFPQP